ncbi:MAG: SUMF1/EgtB/PvdO family nonheme iron enzyme [Myxococcales bacterium]
MSIVEGEYCSIVRHRCIEPYPDGSGRCRRFAAPGTCHSPTTQLRFCMDEFEYPNRRGEKPTVMVTFDDAQRACGQLGKRLCSAREWTLACEGPERLPYPTGLVRDRTLCNVDLAHRFPDVAALLNPKNSAAELARLDQRTPSGAMAGCVSAFGIYDLMGNVDEWVIPDGPEEAAGFGSKTALKGGYFGPVRARCRPSTPSHGLTFKFYQVGFRCCSDAD